MLSSLEERPTQKCKESKKNTPKRWQKKMSESLKSLVASMIYKYPKWKTSCWVQPIWKILVKLDHFPKDRGENKKKLKPPSRKRVTSFWEWKNNPKILIHQCPHWTNLPFQATAPNKKVPFLGIQRTMEFGGVKMEAWFNTPNHQLVCKIRGKIFDDGHPNKSDS